MTSKYLVKFYFMTLLIGTAISTFISLIVEYENVTSYLFAGEVGEFLAGLIWLITFGLLIATISQVAYFIYLFVHPLGKGIFKSFWPYAQLLLIMYAIFDLFYLRFYQLGLDSGNMWAFMWVPLFIIVVAIFVARYKNQHTSDRNVFIPSLFFMIFMTSVTMIPFITVEDTSWIFRSVFAIIILNAYQLIRLPEYVEASQQEKRERGRVTKSDVNERKKKEMREQEEAARKKEDRHVKAGKKSSRKNRTKTVKKD